jgi:hypothetical protein
MMMGTNSATTVRIVPCDPDDPGALYMHYADQYRRQPCYVELSCSSGRLEAGYSASIGSGLPSDAYHGHSLRWSLPLITSDAANRLLERIAPLAQQILDGYTSEWDGSNMRGSYDETASAAEDAIADIINGLPADDMLRVCRADEWLEYATPADLGITAETTADDIRKIAKRICEDAWSDDRYIDYADMIRELQSYREWASQDA